jgi:hypothetical protein
VGDDVCCEVNVEGEWKVSGSGKMKEGGGGWRMMEGRVQRSGPRWMMME